MLGSCLGPVLGLSSAYLRPAGGLLGACLGFVWGLCRAWHRSGNCGGRSRVSLGGVQGLGPIWEQCGAYWGPALDVFKVYPGPVLGPLCACLGLPRVCLGSVLGPCGDCLGSI